MRCIEVLGLPIPVWIRPLTAGDWCDYLDHAEGTIEANAWLVARCVCDDEGNRLFTDDAVATINGLSAGFVNHISDAVLRESGVAGRDWTAERQAFRRGKHRRFGYQLARDFNRDDAEAFLSQMSPMQYQRWKLSYDLDPPAEGVLRLTNGLLADLIAAYRNVNFVDANKEHLKLTARDILPKEADEDEDEATPTVDEAAADAALSIALAANPLGAIATGHGLVMGSGAPLPASVLGAFFKGGDEG